MTANVRNTKTDLITIGVEIKGKVISDEYQILSIRVDHFINKIAKATIVIKDGDPSKGDFEASDSDYFVPGNEIEIKAGYHSKNKTIFKGIISVQSIRSGSSGKSVLKVECCDKSIKMTIHRKEAIFSKMTDNQAINKLIHENGLQGVVESTSVKYGELVQYSTSDWDFMLSRAEVNGMIVITEGGKVTVQKPKLSEAPKLKAIYGSSIYHFNLDMDAKTQLTAVKSTAWDLGTQKALQASSTEPTVNKQGNITGKKLAEIFSTKPQDNHSTVPLGQKNLKSWSDAFLLKSRMAKIRGKYLH